MMEKEIEEEQEMLCERCRRPTLVSDIKYMPKGDGSRIALCQRCRAKPQVMEKFVLKKEEPAKEAYHCSRCNYHFRFNPSGLGVLKCPYCGRQDKLQKV